MADRICVMNDGRIQQLGSPLDVYYRPRTEFVARFFGDNNLIGGRLGAVDGEIRDIETELGRFLCAVDAQEEVKSVPAGHAAFAVIRPESIHLAMRDSELAGYDNRLPATVTAIEFSGATTLVRTMPRHAGNAAFASSIARFVSAAPMFGTVPTTAPLAGLSTLIVPPPSAATHSPPMKQASRSSEGSFRVSFETLSSMSHGLVDYATIVTPPLYMNACTFGSVPEHG